MPTSNNDGLDTNSSERRERIFEFGPDIVGDLRQQRPYFLLPLNKPEQIRSVQTRIRAWIAKSVAEKGPVTDLYIFSHGWHRNFFSAIAAYDRLISRLAILLHRGRLPCPPGYHPIFVNLHWHSDPGEDQWMDGLGRRHKESFLRNVETRFERSLPTFTTDFEDIFELFSTMSAPDINALRDTGLARTAAQSTPCLDGYALRDAPNATAYDKAAVVWTCYHEAQPKRVLIDQNAPAGRFMGFRRTFLNFLQFVVGAVGLLAFLGFLLRLLAPYRRPLISLLAPFWNTAAKSLNTPVLSGQAILIALILFFLFVSSVLILKVNGRLLRSGTGRQAKGVPVFRLAAWAYLEFWAAIPLTAYCLLTYFLSGLTRPLSGLFDERIGKRDQPPRPEPHPFARERLAALARIPVRMLDNAIRADSRLNSLVDVLDSQLAFWEMQRRGTEMGPLAARTIAELLTENPGLSAARLHLVGHSFGALVVCNVVRHLALDPDIQARIPKTFTGTVHSLSLLQPAVASNWFEREPTVCRCVSAVIACVYSRYDTANGFFYPLSNEGRLAAGYVGLFGGATFQPEYRRRFTSLVQPPDLDDPRYTAPPQPPLQPGWPRMLNLDAGRLIYQGPVLQGGGHDDIFKDDVINLIWAVTRLSQPQKAVVATMQSDSRLPSPAVQKRGRG